MHVLSFIKILTYMTFVNIPYTLYVYVGTISQTTNNRHYTK